VARRSLRALNEPVPVHVDVGHTGSPTRVDGRAVEAVREEWRVEEGWWTDAPIRRRYLEVVLVGGRVTVIFEDRRTPGTWFAQRG
jgi:hypothetical protein